MNTAFNVYRIPTELDSYWFKCARLTAILTRDHHKLSSENNAARHCILIYFGLDRPCRQSYIWEEAYSMHTVKMYFNFLGWGDHSAMNHKYSFTDGHNGVCIRIQEWTMANSLTLRQMGEDCQPG